MPKRILVVDDDENILSLERTILEQKGFLVTTAGGGEEALKLLREQVYDLVLLDVMMPDKDGFEVTKDGEFLVETVMCLAGCNHAPMFQVQDANGIHYHESPSIDQPLTADQALAIMDEYKRTGKSS